MQLHSSIRNEIPKNQSLILFFLGWLGLWVFALFFAVILPIIVPFILNQNDTAIFLESPMYFQVINLFTYLSIFMIGTLILFPYIHSTLIPAIKTSKWLLGFPFTFVILLSSYTLMATYDYLGITLEDNQNQAAIVSLVQDSPWISLLTFGFLGPIVEEWTYRLGIFKYLAIKSKVMAYLLTLTIFGFIHFDFTSANLVNEFLNLPIYLIAGAWFCFLYDRFGLQVAISTHIINNVLSVLSIISQSWLMNSSGSI
ncbi:MAG: type II CAAX prenyl endopeptidase Rce1 family protein [Bacilli bacterium]